MLHVWVTLEIQYPSHCLERIYLTWPEAVYGLKSLVAAAENLCHSSIKEEVELATWG